MKQLAMVLATASLALASPVHASNTEENSAFSVDASSSKMSYVYDGVEYDYSRDEVTLTGDVAGGTNTLETYAARAEAAKQAEQGYRDMQETFGVDAIKPNDFWWNSKAAPGDLRVVVSIKRQLAFVYRGNTLVGAASVFMAYEGFQLLAYDYAAMENPRRILEGAVPLAIIMKNRDRFRGKRVGVVITGGNVDLDRLPWTQG